MRRAPLFAAVGITILACGTSTSDPTPVKQASDQPYPPSPIVANIVWHEDTHLSAAPGSDLWPTTWADDDNVYAAWGDGGGFGGTNREGRVSLGFARIEGGPNNFRAFNINGGKNSEHPPTWICSNCGKVSSLISVDGLLYAWLNLQNRPFPEIDKTLVWSEDHGATWQQAAWVLPPGAGNFQPYTFINVDRDHRRGGPYVYFYGGNQTEGGTEYLGRAPREELTDRSSYEFFVGLDDAGQPVWSREISQMRPVHVDPNGSVGGHTVFNPGIQRYVKVTSRGGGGEIGVFDAPEPWGPWTTVAYYEDWLDAGGGRGLVYNFVPKWTSEDGLTMWLVFSANDGAPVYDDRFNLVKATLELRNSSVD